MQVMKEGDDTPGRVQLDDAYWGGERRGSKRGQGASGRTPFIAAAELNRERRPVRTASDLMPGGPPCRLH